MKLCFHPPVRYVRPAIDASAHGKEEAMHYFVYDRPAGCVSTENPARFTWMPLAQDEAPYRI